MGGHLCCAAGVATLVAAHGRSRPPVVAALERPRPPVVAAPVVAARERPRPPVVAAPVVAAHERPCPDLQKALQHQEQVFGIITRLSILSTMTLLPDGVDEESFLNAELKDIDNTIAKVTQAQQNPRWNKTYGKGEGGTTWVGPLKDGLSRGEVPYYCPGGWLRFSLKVCEDDGFKDLYGDWCYLYHGTNSKHIAPILMSGLRAGKGCYCGPDAESLVYMSPSIEYSGHPRYGCLEYNPETRTWYQFVLQCRVKPSAVWQKHPETMCCKQFGLRCDPNVPNDEIEWLLKPNWKDPITGGHYLKDVIVCTGIMVRMTDRHPFELGYWWSQDPAYLKRWKLHAPVDPSPPLQHTWEPVRNVKVTAWKALENNPLASTYGMTGETTLLGDCELSELPFGQGGMRLAYYLRTRTGELFAIKKFSEPLLRYISTALQISEGEAVMKDVHTYLGAQTFAEHFNAHLAHVKLGRRNHRTNYINFLPPLTFKMTKADGTTCTLFGEGFIGGRFIKWNSNAGFVNDDKQALAADVDALVGAFCHYTYMRTKGNGMVVDLQGWNIGSAEDSDNRQMIFTDPQIHTASKTESNQCRRQSHLYKRFSVGNLGNAGMVRFFQGHRCENNFCHDFGIPSDMKPVAGKIHANNPKRGSLLG